ncbi:putative F-box domain-containing protein [Rosa chinensis]|uniref:Putative F-box domain-containing protein n=1 Tax=Rosa chinensis TaxID=74649 RepID=A0A2P6QRI0_ROSCH|nr:F-box protein SKIP22 [Rosa chinensis]PRQ36785.1 putative F-box domain-containing protein [Rosa chinensis]
MVFPSLSPFFAAYRDGYPVWLDEKKFAPAMIDFVWGNNRFDDCHVNVGLLERQVTEIRNIVKNEIALPLLIDLCAVAGLRAPPCLMGLPAELGAKILKSLPGEDIARVSCVCKELRNLANDDELWKQKFAEEFGLSGNEVGDRKSWKSWFVVNWKNKKETNKEKGKIIVGYWWRRKKYDREWPPLR